MEENNDKFKNMIYIRIKKRILVIKIKLKM